MNIKTINNKPEIIKDGVKMIDFAEPTYIPQYDSGSFVVTRRITVSPEYDMRPDLLSLALYGTDDYVDILMKCNEISSPLHIREGDLILVPEPRLADSFYTTPTSEDTTSRVSDKYLDPSKKSQEDENRLESMRNVAKSVKNGSSDVTRPNELKPTDKNLTKSNDSIII